jgi:hypothetical protein
MWNGFCVNIYGNHDLFSDLKKKMRRDCLFYNYNFILRDVITTPVSNADITLYIHDDNEKLVLPTSKTQTCIFINLVKNKPVDIKNICDLSKWKVYNIKELDYSTLVFIIMDSTNRSSTFNYATESNNINNLVKAQTFKNDDYSKIVKKNIKTIKNDDDENYGVVKKNIKTSNTQ